MRRGAATRSPVRAAPCAPKRSMAAASNHGTTAAASASHPAANAAGSRRDRGALRAANRVESRRCELPTRMRPAGVALSHAENTRGSASLWRTSAPTVRRVDIAVSEAVMPAALDRRVSAESENPHVSSSVFSTALKSKGHTAIEMLLFAESIASTRGLTPSWGWTMSFI
jgi:hypothetical protein